MPFEEKKMGDGSYVLSASEQQAQKLAMDALKAAEDAREAATRLHQLKATLASSSSSSSSPSSPTMAEASNSRQYTIPIVETVDEDEEEDDIQNEDGLVANASPAPAPVVPAPTAATAATTNENGIDGTSNTHSYSESLGNKNEIRDDIDVNVNVNVETNPHGATTDPFTPHQANAAANASNEEAVMPAVPTPAVQDEAADLLGFGFVAPVEDVPQPDAQNFIEPDLLSFDDEDMNKVMPPAPSHPAAPELDLLSLEDVPPSTNAVLSPSNTTGTAEEADLLHMNVPQSVAPPVVDLLPFDETGDRVAPQGGAPATFQTQEPPAAMDAFAGEEPKQADLLFSFAAPHAAATAAADQSNKEIPAVAPTSLPTEANADAEAGAPLGKNSDGAHVTEETNEEQPAEAPDVFDLVSLDSDEQSAAVPNGTMSDFDVSKTTEEQKEEDEPMLELETLPVVAKEKDDVDPDAEMSEVPLPQDSPPAVVETEQPEDSAVPDTMDSKKDVHDEDDNEATVNVIAEPETEAAVESKPREEEFVAVATDTATNDGTNEDNNSDGDDNSHDNGHNDSDDDSDDEKTPGMDETSISDVGINPHNVVLEDPSQQQPMQTTDSGAKEADETKPTIAEPKGEAGRAEPEAKAKENDASFEDVEIGTKDQQPTEEAVSPTKTKALDTAIVAPTGDAKAATPTPIPPTDAGVDPNAVSRNRDITSEDPSPSTTAIVPADSEKTSTDLKSVVDEAEVEKKASDCTQLAVESCGCRVQ